MYVLFKTCAIFIFIPLSIILDNTFYVCVSFGKFVIILHHFCGNDVKFIIINLRPTSQTPLSSWTYTSEHCRYNGKRIWNMQNYASTGIWRDLTKDVFFLFCEVTQEKKKDQLNSLVEIGRSFILQIMAKKLIIIWWPNLRSKHGNWY